MRRRFSLTIGAIGGHGSSRGTVFGNAEAIAAADALIQKQKKEYRDEKKRVAAELVSALRDPTVVVMADWLKVRGTLRKWQRYYCVLKPGLLLVYKTDKTHKVGLELRLS